jgi:hypothetical protein
MGPVSLPVTILDEAMWNAATTKEEKAKLILDYCIIPWNGVSGMEDMNSLDSDVLAKLHQQVMDTLAGFEWGKMKTAILAGCQSPHKVCVWQRLGTTADRRPNEHSACKSCQAKKKICLLRLKAPNQQAFMAPLATNVRPKDATPNQMAYWVLP